MDGLGSPAAVGPGMNPSGAILGSVLGAPTGMAPASANNPDGAVPDLLPTITRPTGGGAIRGVGEKFAANPVRGSGATSIPLGLSPGRGGFGPSLELSYDSQAGNGPFGFGWALSLPRVTRKTDKGVPRYRDHEESDVFVLSGAEDLVPVLDATGRRHETRDPASGHVVRRYRPRVEGLFARIERWTDPVTGEAHWRSISRENVTTVYGRTPESRIADPDDPRRIFEWSVCETVDAVGNAVVYDYVAEDDTGVHGPRRGRGANRYLRRIRYGNRISRLVAPDLDDAEWLFEAVFDYDEDHLVVLPPRADRAPDAQHESVEASVDVHRRWPVRPDSFLRSRSGFEVWTHRRCRRVLMFHHFAELGDGPTLVRSTEFDYRDARGGFADVDAELAHAGSGRLGSFLCRVRVSGHVRRADRTYRTCSLPPVEFDYTRAHIDDRLRELDASSRENLPVGAGGSTQWVDLDGEGLPGLLTRGTGGWFYKPNRGDGRFGPLRRLPTRPSQAGASPTERLMDLDADGSLDLVTLGGPMPGFSERDGHDGWNPFRPFRHRPAIDWASPFTSLVDLSGDGFADAVVAGPASLTWYRGLGEEGFDAPEIVLQDWAREDGPRLLFHDAQYTAFFADMNGDGLADFVRVGNGAVDYWPSYGYGRFGARITMANGPWFDPPGLFDQRRLLLADIDGSGTTDLVYLGSDGVRLYFNLTGQGWTDARPLPTFPRPHRDAEITTADVLGNGTACLVWSTRLSGSLHAPMAYLDLMGGQKPHLLVGIRNGMGAETRIDYAPSTRFSLADQEAGRPWATRVPFPVHVVERVETVDHVARTRFTTRYGYHEGYFDGREREFGGFGVVEQTDTEELAALSDEGTLWAVNLDAASHVPAVLTRSFFHTGAPCVARYRERSFREPGELGLPDPVLPAGSDPDERREAHRALRGALMRQEVYARDGGERAALPYSVTERTYAVRMLQPRAGQRHGVFLVHDREQLDRAYERSRVRVREGCLSADPRGHLALDPRVSHVLTLATDEFGNVLRAASVAYGRRHRDPALPAPVQAAQAQVPVVHTASRVTTPLDEPDAWRPPSPYEVRTDELTGFTPTGPGGRFRPEDLDPRTAAVIGHHERPSGARERRLLSRRVTVFRADDLSTALPPGRIGARGLTDQSYTLALTTEILREALGARVDEEMLADGGYLPGSGNEWWAPSGRVFYSPHPADGPEAELAHARHHFFRPHRARDAFDAEHLVHYDRYALLVAETVDALGNRTTVGERGRPDHAGQDYRVLAPRSVMDPNRNREVVAHDALGRVAGRAVMGPPEDAEPQGDRLVPAFRPDLTHAEIDALLDDPADTAPRLLGEATSRVVVDTDAYTRGRGPAVTATLARETHVSDGPTRVRVTFAYADGTGREIQSKLPAEPQRAGGAPRWTGTGWTVYDNKGRPVRRYEPFFTDTHRFEFDVRAGVSPIVFYDPLSRVVGTLYPDRTWTKTRLGSWSAEVWDGGDTLRRDAGADDVLGDLLRRLPPEDHLPSWYDARIDGGLGPDEQVAARRAEIAADTPTVLHADSLGRTVLSVAHNRTPVPGGGTREEQLASRVTLDVEGRQRELVDARGRVVMLTDYDMVGAPLATSSMEAGRRWMLGDVDGRARHSWDERGHVLRSTYDALRRPVAGYLREGDGPELMITRRRYGEELPDAEQHNLRGRVVEVADQAGLVTTQHYDFKGNVLTSARRLATEHRDHIDWSNGPTCEAWSFTGHTRYDALDRPVQTVPPRPDEHSDHTVIQPVYNEANLLERLDVWLDRAGVPDGLLDATAETPATVGVAAVEYDAAGRRRLIDHRNGTSTRYDHDPTTQRLVRQRTWRPGDEVQDLRYTYDPVGNAVRIADGAVPDVFFRNARVEATADYHYDAVARLVAATGREHLGQGGPVPSSPDDRGHTGLHPEDGAAMGRYRETYAYDPAGNLVELRHTTPTDPQQGWTRHLAYDEPSLLEPAVASNRLSATTTGGTVERFGGPDGYDAHGNMRRLPHLAEITWNHADQVATSRRRAGDGEGDRTYDVYDAAGERVRKVTEGPTGAVHHERIYLGGYEVYRRHGSRELTRETLHVNDGRTVVALVETRTAGDEQGVPARLVRYQVTDHRGWSTIELDDEARIITREEYSPWRATTYQAVRSQTQTPKRYRAGQERDEETGFYHHHAREYAPWLCRWVSCDPIGTGDAPCTSMSTGPVRIVDPNRHRGNTMRPHDSELRRSDIGRAPDNGVRSDTPHRARPAELLAAPRGSQRH